MAKSGIYKITNIINNEFYVGSSKDMDVRWRQHKRLAKRYIEGHGGVSYLYRAIQKFGIENFQMQIIEECTGKDTLISKEQYYVDTLKPVYNILLKVNAPGCGTWTSERKTAYSIRRKAEVAAGINVPPITYMTGNTDFRHAEESKAKMRKSVAQARERIISERGSYLTPEGLASRRAKREASLTPERRERYREETKAAVIKAHAVLTEKADVHAEQYKPIIRELQEQGLNLLQIAAKLNENGHTTRRGMPWTDQAIRLLLRRLNESTETDRIEAPAKARKKNSDEFARAFFPIIDELRRSGLNMSEIANKLNEAGHKSRRGCAWTYANVREILKRVENRANPQSTPEQPEPEPILHLGWNRFIGWDRP
jgi:group I intron endonuclease